MKRFFPIYDVRLAFMLTLVVFLLLPSIRVEADVYSGSRIFWDTNTRRTVFASGGYARIIQLQDGHLMAVCESGGIQIIFSNDKGSSWSGQKKIVANTNNTPNCVPDLIQLRDGTIIVAYNPRPSTPYTEDRRFGIRCKRSTDNGRTWSDEIFVNDASYTFGDGCWEPSMLELPSGELQLYFADEGPFTSSNEQQISLCRSFDGGLTWSAAKRICFRAGYRDGMPVPVLLKDESEIVVAIEDNGWGYGDFLPTTVRSTLANNWRSWVSANNKNREMALNLAYCPVATGGAPYLRVLPWGETVLCHQSPYENDGKIQMRVAVGNDRARDFKAVSLPFGQGDTNPQGLWNSLAVIDTGIVVAVSGINGKIEMIKGYPTRLLQAPYAHPSIDGTARSSEGYFSKTASQIILGTQTGIRFIADFAYDMDSLYFAARVNDRTRVVDATAPDAVTLLLDTEGAASDSPQPTSYRLTVTPAGDVQLQQGHDTWQDIDASALHVAISGNSSYYAIEVAIPWQALGCETAPVGHRLSAATAFTDNRTTAVVTEGIPDAHPLQPFTWMELRLQPTPTAIKDLNGNSPSSIINHQSSIETYDLSGRKVSVRSTLGRFDTSRNVPFRKGIYIQGGQKRVTL